ncbi:Ankyrin repeat and KH domain-containing protein 1 [Cinnamomum micranthum f. kanehirae]|uniref:Ankyrin repeat and KH domain-containing protein 1 n=1 Tax=Cinnamomum micranthum f. kanehirae TaxID=337451 RepID=A0A443Q563_9MAGN|nr:Ankyrin repeat and KH domain-containing protein 1 [Cinnamomum micranthum f. kanehirae]
MKTIWCADSASKAYIETIKSVKPSHYPSLTSSFEESNVAELLSAMAAGSKSQMIVEAWASGTDVATSIGLSIASSHTRGRHVCVVQDERSRLEYLDAICEAGLYLRRMWLWERRRRRWEGCRLLISWWSIAGARITRNETGDQDLSFGGGGLTHVRGYAYGTGGGTLNIRKEDKRYINQRNP